ncbi:MAG: TonB-dependent receptor domain-containing protein, partial [Gammaproteobacteria bacterium]
RPEGTVRANGLPVAPRRAGRQADGGADDLANAADGAVTYELADNAALVQDNFNDTIYLGGRLSIRYDINDDWKLSLTHARQGVESDGVFFSDPDLGSHKTQRFVDEGIDDNYHNSSWTLEGRIAGLTAIYTGAYTDRETDQIVDYTDYMFVGQYLPYYICDIGVTYPASDPNTGDTPEGTCYSPELLLNSQTGTEVQTHEFRLATDSALPLRGTLGGFYSDTVVTELNDFTYLSSTEIKFQDGTSANFAPNRPFMTGHFSDPGPFPEAVIFRNDIKRTDEQYGIFGQLEWDVTDQITLTAGARYYDVTVDMDGSANTSFCNNDTDVDQDAFGTDISDLYNGDGRYTFINSCSSGNRLTYTLDPAHANDPNLHHPDSITNEATKQRVLASLAAPDAAEANGWIGKASLAYALNSDTLIYATWSQGFRPGLLNRPGGLTNANVPGYSIPFVLKTDDVTNYEIGWKADLFGGNLRFNGTVFFVEVQNLQTTIYDPNIVNLFFSDNAADAEILGFEGDMIWQPLNIDGLTVSGAFSFLDSKITKKITPTDDVREGDELAFAPTFQGNLRARYEWPLGGVLTAHVMPHLSWSTKSYSDIITINRDQIEGWMMLGIAGGVEGNNWSGQLYIDNLTDENAELSRDFTYDLRRVTYAQPRTIGFRFSRDF